MQDPAVFDRVVMVDWSANSTPKTGKDSIWAAEVVVGTGQLRSANLRTRHDARTLLTHVFAQPGRVLLGVDFSLGFPSGTAAALGLGSPSWSAMWAELARLVVDDARNRNNRFQVAADLNGRVGHGAGPFWGCPPSQAGDHLTVTKVPCEPLTEWRTVERRLHERSEHPFSAWQLMGAGAVGSQSLLGIAALHRLVAGARRRGRSVDVWPFTTGLATPEAEVVVVEVWPTLATLPDPTDDPWDARVRDQLQVETLATAFAAPGLGSWFSPDVPAAALPAVLDEEGWVFGVT